MVCRPLQLNSAILLLEKQRLRLTKQLRNCALGSTGNQFIILTTNSRLLSSYKLHLSKIMKKS